MSDPSSVSAASAVGEVLEPPIQDDSGYRLRYADLEFLRIRADEVNLWRERRAPLGMPPAYFDAFVASLRRVLVWDRLDHVDVRLKGSSAGFFGGLHKQLPTSLDDIRREYEKSNHGRRPEPEVEAHILARIDDVWPLGARPLRRPFDAMHVLGIDPHPSDYDLQVSSDELLERALEHSDRYPDGIRVRSQTYDFIEKDLYDEICPALVTWAMKRSQILRREVTLAVFGGSGPPNKEVAEGLLSSHFRRSDWVLVAEEPSE